MMKLTGAQIGEFTSILSDAFSRGELTFLVRTKLNLILSNEVSTNENDRDIAFNLVDDLNRKGRALELIRVVSEDRPADTKIKEFQDRLLAEANGSAQPAPAEGLRKAVHAFQVQFQARLNLFGFLRAH